MSFIALDVETANSDLASICQIGIAKYVDGQLVEEWSSLVNPEDEFDLMNVNIHGITEDDVIGSPTFPEITDTLFRFLQGTVCVTHTHFDRASIRRALEKYELKEMNAVWLDSARVARRTWEECAWGGYGLANLCRIIGYEFRHHDALEDAKAAGQIMLAAIGASGIDLESWLTRVEQPIKGHRPIERAVNPEGALYGEVVVFTGSLGMSRAEAAELATIAGCCVESGVNKKTTLLVVGNQDIKKLAGKEKSTKHLKAEQLIAMGQRIRILQESDFVELVEHA